ncbi:MAG: hypothetical protein ACLTER_09310 [Ruminococcus sp.]
MWVQEIMETLDQNGFEYDMSDCYVTPEKLAQYDVVFTASYNFMETMDPEKLLVFPDFRKTAISGTICTGN